MHIAQNQEGGKGGILPKTVMGHVMTALSQGRSVDLKVQGSVSIIILKKRKWKLTISQATFFNLQQSTHVL